MSTTNCQLCASPELTVVIDLGQHPLADTFLRREDLGKSQRRYPLKVLLCLKCGYVTLETVVSAEERYTENDYSYTSSNSPVAISHFEGMAEQIISLARVTRNDVVVDIGSNVGTLLEAFRKQTNCTVVGVEPARNIAALANDTGILTLERFFDDGTVDEILRTRGHVNVITATNVYNHISDLDSFMSNITKLLTPTGVFVFEVPYLATLIKTRAFDTIYLEHVSYFAVKPLRAFYRKFGLHIQYLETNTYMGGSIRMYVGKGTEGAEVKEYVEAEELSQLFSIETYAEFTRDIRALRDRVVKEIGEIQTKGEKIIGIGAATKGNTFLNYCGIDHSMLAFITDSSPLKIGKYTPGSRIPIKSDSDITPDIKYALILPWNIADFLTKKLNNKNLKFIVPKYEDHS